MADIPTNEPLKIQAGDTIKWKRTFSDYPAGTWTLTYYLVKDGTQLTITATADGTDHSVTIAKATSAGYAEGIYHWQAVVDDGSERFKVDEGTFEVLPDFQAAIGGLDNRSDAQKMYEGITALLVGKITKNDLDVLSYEINSVLGRKVQKMSLADLRAERTKWKAEWDSEIEAERIANGLGTGRKISTRFAR